MADAAMSPPPQGGGGGGQEVEVLGLNQRLLEAIATGDYATYGQLCDPLLTAFEPEAAGHLVEGLEFHKFFFDAQRAGADGYREGVAKCAPPNVTMSDPRVRLVGDGGCAVVTCVRLVQLQGPDGTLRTTASEETRVWEKSSGSAPGDGVAAPPSWRMVHFHKSTTSSSWASS